MFPRKNHLNNKRRSPRVTEEIAIAHDYLTQKGGAERVVLAMHKAYPQATIYTTLYDPKNTYPEFKDANIVVSPLNKIGFFRKNHRAALPLLALASSLMRVPARKTLVSSTGWAHGFRFAGKSFVYCHSPARWLYLSDQYLGQYSPKIVRMALRILRPWLILWDRNAARKASTYVANSTEIRRRISRVYQRPAEVFFPPFASTQAQSLEPIAGLENFMAGEDYFLIVSRLLPYKNIHVALEAFRQTDKKLLVIGAGPMAQELYAMGGSNVRFASNISDAQMRYAYAHCLALLAISYEDFGLTPLECGVFGKPTIALEAGGYLDTIVEGLNGHFIKVAAAPAIRAAVRRFNPEDWDAQRIKEHTAQFSEERFIRVLHEYMEKL